MDGNTGAGAAGAVTMIVYLALIALMIASMWKVFEKAGQPGWAAIVPIYNIYILLKIAGKPDIWLLLFLIPIVNIVIAVMTYISLAERFGKSTGFALGLIFLSPIFFPILGFGDAQYKAD